MTGTVTLELIPTNYFTLISSAVEEALDEVLAKYSDIDIENATESQMITINTSLAEAVLSKISGLESHAESADPVEKTYEVDCQNGYIRNNDWTDIHATIMGIDALQEQK